MQALVDVSIRGLANMQWAIINLRQYSEAALLLAFGGAGH